MSKEIAKTTGGHHIADHPEYRQFIEDLKMRVVSARISAARAVNRDLILLYRDIGRGIVEKQRLHNWGESVVEMVAADLRRSFPGSRSFSSDNVWRMRQFHLAYVDTPFLGQAVPETASAESRSSRSAIPGQAVPETSPAGIAIGSGATTPCLELLTTVPWGQKLLILKKLADPAHRLYYLRTTSQFGWSRNILLNQIKAGTYSISPQDLRDPRECSSSAVERPLCLAA